MTRNYPNRMSLWHGPEPVARPVAFSFLPAAAKLLSAIGPAASSFFAVPLAVRIHEGLVWCCM
jgi:hypothetical protein